MAKKYTKARHAGGRPKGLIPPLAVISFRADDETRKAIDKLTEAAMETLPGVVGGGARGIAIRQALLEAAAQLAGKRKGGP